MQQPHDIDDMVTTKEKKSLETLLELWVSEHRSQRRWGIFFKIIYVLVSLFVVFSFFGLAASSSTGSAVGHGAQPHAAIIELNGVIASDAQANSTDISESLVRAFKNKHARGIILKVNSPGGSPVESSVIFDEVNRLRAKYPAKKVYAVCGDICASGGYFIAASANEIVANPMSLVGSIGVRLDSFGFVAAMEKLGVTRRLFTAGENKGMLDPFLPVDSSSEKHIHELLRSTHQQFIKSVKQGRAGRLKKNDNLFSGLFWTAAQAKQFGLIDGFGSVNTVAREKIGVKYTVNYTIQPSPLDRIAGRIGATMTNQLQSWFAIR